jgi:predicted CopG family antitoxin
MANIYIRRDIYDKLVKLGYDPAKQANAILEEWIRKHEKEVKED